MKKASKNIIIFLICVVFLYIATIAYTFITRRYTQASNNDLTQNNKFTVILDAGHGGEDGGAVGVTGVLEKDLNLAITFKVGNELKSRGINVIYTRTEDTMLYDKNSDYKNQKKSLDLAERLKIANNTQNPIFISIHMNSFSQSKYSGLQVYYSKNNQLSYQLANCIQSAVQKEIQHSNNRKSVEATSRIYLLDRLLCPAVLIECGFVSNFEECRLLATEIYQKQLAKIISEEIANYVEKNSQILLTNQ